MGGKTKKNSLTPTQSHDNPAKTFMFVRFFPLPGSESLGALSTHLKYERETPRLADFGHFTCNLGNF